MENNQQQSYSKNNEENQSKPNMRQDSQPTESKTAFKDVGKKSLEPLVNLFQSRKEDLKPYLEAIGTGLDGALKSFENLEGNEATEYISNWFSDAKNWFSNVKEKLASKDSSELLKYFESEAKNRPALMFSVSYVAGLIFGRLGKHAGQILH